MRYSKANNRDHRGVVTFHSPSDKGERSFETYVAPDRQRNERSRIIIVPYPEETLLSLMASFTKRPALNMVTKMHRYTHATAEEMQNIFDDARIINKDVDAACRKEFEACDICASSGEPQKKKKISISHVNEALNQKVQADFTVAMIKGETFHILNMVYMGTGYGERAISNTHEAEALKRLLEIHWILHHGAPAKFNADPEFCRPILQKVPDKAKSDLRIDPLDHLTRMA